MKNLKMKKVITTLISSLLIIASLTGCAAGNVPQTVEENKAAANTPNSAKASFSVFNVDAKELIDPYAGEESASAKAAAAGANDFAFKLSSALVKDAGNKNFVCSPYSVWMPLAALVNATDSKYKDELLAALGASGISEDDLNDAVSRMLYSLTKEGNKRDAQEYDNPEFYQDPLKIANAIFVDNDVTIKKDFAQKFMDYYRGSVMNVDFGKKDAVNAVNKWASDSTEGLITDIINEFDPYTIACIANAIYFSDRWASEFNPDDTKEGVFHAASQDTNAQYMLREGDQQAYYEDDDIQAIDLRFKTGGGMYIILPRNGDATGLLASMTSEYFDKMRQNTDSKTGRLLLPRFKIESGVMQLKDTLKALGIPIFDENTAPLTGGLVEDDLKVWASSAAHKAMIEVDEKGTTAAAVTTIAITGMSMPIPTEPFEMVCDKPFVFVLYGDTYDGGSQVLFTGVVSEP